MDDDDDKPRRPVEMLPIDLSSLSVADLEAAIGRMEGEIARARAAIVAKRAVRGGADALFSFKAKGDDA